MWLAKYAGVPEDYHGVDAFAADDAVPWTQWLQSLLIEPVATIEVESILKQHRGLSANNPYMKPKRMTYEYELRPGDIAERIMQTAATISREWVEDLSLMPDESEAVWRSRRAVTLESDAEVRATGRAFTLRMMTPGLDSPYRGGTYELLLALATRRAAQSALAALAAQPKEWPAREMLASACDKGLFQGELGRHAADCWLAEMLDMPISLRVGGSLGEPALCDPRGVVEQILEWRGAIANDWIAQLESVPDAILQVKREHVRQVSKYLVTG